MTSPPPQLKVPQQQQQQQQQQPDQQQSIRSFSWNSTIVLIFVTHRIVNSLLLGPWNPIRCAYWNQQVCTDDENWILNWYAFGMFHSSLLVAALLYNANGKLIYEQRLIVLISIMMVSSLSSGIYMMDHLNKSMAVIQTLIYFILLATITYGTATAPPVLPLPSELRSSSFDARKKLPISATSLGCLFLLSLLRLVDMIFISGRDDGYLGNISSVLYTLLSNAATVQMMWCTVLLGYSIFLASMEQQKNVLTGQVVALFISQILLEGQQGTKIESSQLRTGAITTFCAILLGILGII